MHDSKTLPQSNIRVLYIEDNEADVVLISEMLAHDVDYGTFELRHTDRLADGMDRIAENDIDVVLLDLGLPDSVGIETLHDLQHAAKGTPVIVFTGYSDGGLAVQAVQSGAQDYLVKGQIDGNSLSRAIRYAIERQQMVAELQEAREQERYNALHDRLTGLPNRDKFYEDLKTALGAARPSGQAGAAVLLDLDGFKRINDTFGHNSGDLLLQMVSKRLRRCLRETDVVARFGGDEFMFFFDGLENPRSTEDVIHPILNALGDPFWIADQKMTITASMGVSLYPHDTTSIDTLVKNADIAMYHAKEKGKNRCAYYDDSLDSGAAERLKLETSIERALQNDEFRVYYQPQIDVQSGALTGMEALVRWQHPELGLLGPDRFIPIAEQTGLIVPLGLWILKTVCKQNREWQESGLPHIRVTVNLSARQFMEEELLETVYSALEETGLRAEHLGLEITETNSMQDINYTIETLKAFKASGIHIAIDDFGTGYSSLNYLKRLPLDMLKIDKSFVQGIPDDREDNMITTAMVTLGHNLGLRVLAEGVETDAQQSYLQARGCDEIQGYHFSRPLPAAGIRKILARHRPNSEPRSVY